MSEKAHPCPKCGGTMDYRLGEYQCRSCDYIETAAQQKEERDTPGGQRRESWQSGIGSTLPPSRSGYTGKLLTPPTATGGQTGASPSAYGDFEAPPPPPPAGTVYGQATWEGGAGYGGAGAAISDTLATEKQIYFIIYAALQGLAIVFLLLLLTVGRKALEAALAAGTPPSGNAVNMAQMMEMLPMIIVFYIIVILIAVGLTWWVLYGMEIWPKWCCMGCSVLILLMSVAQLISVFAPSALMMAAGPAGLLGGGVMAFAVITVIIQVGWQVWFMSILYRDIQQRQNR
jgi:hypothetical protein